MIEHAADKLLGKMQKKISVPFNLFSSETLGASGIPLQPSKKLQLRKQNRTETKCCLTEVLIALDHFECSVGDAGV